MLLGTNCITFTIHSYSIQTLHTFIYVYVFMTSGSSVVCDKASVTEGVYSSRRVLHGEPTRGCLGTTDVKASIISRFKCQLFLPCKHSRGCRLSTFPLLSSSKSFGRLCTQLIEDVSKTSVNTNHKKETSEFAQDS